MWVTDLILAKVVTCDIAGRQAGRQAGNTHCHAPSSSAKLRQRYMTSVVVIA
jgi:hypothetical protein